MRTALAAPASRATVEPPETSSRPIVSVGTLVAVTEPPALNSSTSVEVGVARVGVQLPAVVQAADPTAFQVYVANMVAWLPVAGVVVR